ncbi:hypothetical protein NDU88_011884, partial [Pleurodeles waltl]
KKETSPTVLPDRRPVHDMMHDHTHNHTDISSACQAKCYCQLTVSRLPQRKLLPR